MRSSPEAEAYRHLLRRLERRARRLVSDRDLAADLAQEAALRLWRRQQTGTAPRQPDAYAMIVLRNLVASHWRAGPGPEPLEDNTAAVAPAAPVRLALRDLCTAIDGLPAEHTVLLRLTAQGITSPAELARATGVPPGMVMSRLARARARLRARLDLPPGRAAVTLCDPD